MTAEKLPNHPKARFHVQAKIKFVVLLLLSSLLFVTSVPQANAAGTIRKHHKSAFRSRNNSTSGQCAGNNCTIAIPMFGSVLRAVCPDVKTSTCFYYIRVKSQVRVSAGDAGFFRFRVDGEAPSINGNNGGTDGNGYVTWTNGDPDSGTIRWDARSYAVATELENTIADNQALNINVEVGCTDTDGSGSCSVTSGLSSLVVDIESFVLVPGVAVGSR